MSLACLIEWKETWGKHFLVASFLIRKPFISIFLITKIVCNYTEILIIDYLFTSLFKN